AGILASAQAAGAEGLTLVDGAAVRRLEPSVRAVAAIHSARTGTLDAPAFMACLEARARSAGAEFVYGHTLTAAEPLREGFVLEVSTPDGERFRFTSRCLVNAAGLEADRVAALLG